MDLNWVVARKRLNVYDDEALIHFIRRSNKASREAEHGRLMSLKRDRILDMLYRLLGGSTTGFYCQN